MLNELKIQTEYVPYSDEDVTLEGFVAYPKGKKRPAVILCHAWAGRDDFICEKARWAAEKGYVGFALDMYGKGVLGKSKEQNIALKQPFLNDRTMLHRRALQAFKTVQKLPYVDATNIAILGYGFGGMCALDLARCGAHLKGAISVYGHFNPPPTPQPIQTKILVLHGYADPVAPLEEFHQFAHEMETAKVDWQAHLFGNSLHAFATPSANDPKSGIQYNPLSASRADHLIQLFLDEIFATQK